MAKSFQEALRAALQQQKSSAPAKARNAPPLPGEDTTPPPTSVNAPMVERLIEAVNSRGKGGKNFVRVTYGAATGTPAGRASSLKHKQPRVVFPDVKETARYQAKKVPVSSIPVQELLPKKELPRLECLGGAAVALKSANRKLSSLLSAYELPGRAVQIQSPIRSDQREVVVGLDFGTSCVKVVHGDAGLQKSFAVPFNTGGGIERYLLPSAVFQTGGSFSLENGTNLHRDLKLSLLANPEDLMLQMRVSAFLALTIRRARGWLLTEQAAIYIQTEIVWRLTIGLPAAQHFRSPFSDLFERLGSVAWAASVAEEPITTTLIGRILGANFDSITGTEVEVTVVPEIAAQIYGFVDSSSFDRNAQNLYLMADVGAGTVDSSLFRVKPDRGRWSFEFYTSIVEPNGASNLHRHRTRWWGKELVTCGAPESLRVELEESLLITDIGWQLPESYEEYLSGVKIRPFSKEKTPDGEFFERVGTQVRGRTFWRAWKDDLLAKNSLTGVPFFLCGGASRMKFYQRLEPELASIQGCPWLKAEAYWMTVPSDLEAPGVAEHDYDRLSVAYGLSRLEVGKVIQAIPMPKLESVQIESWRENYIDKDFC